MGVEVLPQMLVPEVPPTLLPSEPQRTSYRTDLPKAIQGAVSTTQRPCQRLIRLARGIQCKLFPDSKESSMLRSLAFVCASIVLMGQPHGGAPIGCGDPQHPIREAHGQAGRIGIAVGVLDAKGSRVICQGKLEQGDPRVLNGDTLFEIGSVTKVFTSLLLADSVGRGEVALTDPVTKYLPAGVHLPERAIASSR